MSTSSSIVDSATEQAHSGAARTMPSSQPAMMLLWCVVLCLIMGGRLQWRAEPSQPNDTFQYYSVARNALEGRVGYTSIVHFDAERSFGTVPAPLVTFPVGYPLLLAALVALGPTLDQAAVAINLLAAIACVIVIATAARRLQLSRLATHAAVGGFVLNAAIAWWTTTASTELVFTATITAAVLWLALPRRHESSPSTADALVAGLLVGLSYYLRYAGLFVLVGLVAATVLAWLRPGRLRFRQYAAAALVSGFLMAAGLIRNLLIVGNWRGGNEKPAWHAPLAVGVDTIRAFDHLLLGDRSGVAQFAAHMLWFAVVAAVVSMAVWFGRAGSEPVGRTQSAKVSDFVALTATIMVVYSVCMFYASVTTVISYNSRMFVPMLPLTLILIACGLDAVRSRLSSIARPMQLAAAGGIALLICGYVLLNVPRALSPVNNSRTERIRASLFDDESTGQSAERVLRATLGAHRRILANDGQAIGHLSRIETVSLVSMEYSKTAWTEGELQNAASTFDVGAVVIRRPDSEEAEDADIVPSEFVMHLANLTHPAWLVPVYVTDTLVIYQVNLASAANRLGETPLLGLRPKTVARSADG